MQVSGSYTIAKADLVSAFFQLPVAPQHYPLQTFSAVDVAGNDPTSGRRLFCFVKTFQGSKISSRMMDQQVALLTGHIQRLMTDPKTDLS